MRVVIADDHPAILVGLAGILRRHWVHLRVQAEAHCGKDLLDKLTWNPCDLLITDFHMPNSMDSQDGLALLQELRRIYPKLPIMVVTVVDNLASILGILQLGVQGIVNKAAATTELLTAIDAVVTGRRYLSERARQQLLEWSSSGSGGDVSAREAEVINLVMSGLTVSEIARRSERSVTTIGAQKRAAMRKLGLSTDAPSFESAHTQGMA